MDRDREMDALAAELERVGLIEALTGPDGGIEYRPTPTGARVGRMLAMADPEEAQALVDALLDPQGSPDAMRWEARR